MPLEQFYSSGFGKIGGWMICPVSIASGSGMNLLGDRAISS